MKHYCKAGVKGCHAQWGEGFSAALAESDARYQVEKYLAEYPSRPALDQWTFEPIKLQRPKFKVGQKIRVKGTKAIFYKVSAVPYHPRLNGFVAHDAGFALIWSSEDGFEPVTN